VTIIELVQHPDFVSGAKWAVRKNDDMRQPFQLRHYHVCSSYGDIEELWTGYILADWELVDPEAR
jgi:hypothetical protein